MFQLQFSFFLLTKTISFTSHTYWTPGNIQSCWLRTINFSVEERMMSPNLLCSLKQWILTKNSMQHCLPSIIGYSTCLTLAITMVIFLQSSNPLIWFSDSSLDFFLTSLPILPQIVIFPQSSNPSIWFSDSSSMCNSFF